MNFIKVFFVSLFTRIKGFYLNLIKPKEQKLNEYCRGWIYEKSGFNSLIKKQSAMFGIKSTAPLSVKEFSDWCDGEDLDLSKEEHTDKLVENKQYENNRRVLTRKTFLSPPLNKDELQFLESELIGDSLKRLINKCDSSGVKADVDEVSDLATKEGRAEFRVKTKEIAQEVLSGNNMKEPELI